jgi:8-oxo-dGTP diphosphatase
MQESRLTKTLLPHFSDALYRASYRMAYPLWRLYLRLFRVRTQGAQVVVWNYGRVLLIRNSYRKQYTFPGGYIRRGEDTANAASRELYEETKIAVPADKLRLAFNCSYNHHKQEGHDDIYEIQLASEPRVCIDNREVIEARFVTPDNALLLPLEGHVRQYLKLSNT